MDEEDIAIRRTVLKLFGVESLKTDGNIEASERLRLGKKLMQATSTQGIGDSEELTRRMLGFIAFHFEAYGTGVRLSALNRRYGKIAGRFGVPLRDLLQGAAEADTVLMLMHMNSTVLLPVGCALMQQVHLTRMLDLSVGRPVDPASYPQE